MKIGIVGINIGAKSGADMLEFARVAEAGGVESLWTFEHVIVPLEYASPYPYNDDGKMAATPETNMIDPLVALAAIGAHTTTLRLGTGVNILPQANPLLLAKQAASIDFMTGGRLMLGLGIGWLAEEYDAMGTPFERRGARFDDYVEAMRAVWSGDVVEHQSEFLNWCGFKSHPLPVQSPLPIVIGGSKGRAFDRVARLGQGWYSPSTHVGALRELMTPLAEACDRHGRDLATVEITSMWIPGLEPVEKLAEYAALGVDRLLVPLVVVAAGGPPLDGLRRFVDEVMTKVGALDAAR